MYEVVDFRDDLNELIDVINKAAYFKRHGRLVLLFMVVFTVLVFSVYSVEKEL